MSSLQASRVLERYLKQSGTDDANRMYQERSHDVTQLLKKLQDALKKHAAEQKKNPGDWGFSGDLGYVVDELKNLLQTFEDSQD